MTRIYDAWAGNPKGVKEDPEKCIQSVGDFTGWHFNQCARKRCYGPDGLYCKQHGKKAEHDFEEDRKDTTLYRADSIDAYEPHP